MIENATAFAQTAPLETAPVSPTETAPADPSTEDGDHDRMAHIVFPKDRLTEAMITGEPVTALCGKLWSPSRDPERYPVCAGCVETFESLTGRAWPGRR